MKNKMNLKIQSLSENERFARTVCGAFILPLDPTFDDVAEIKTAISEAVTNAIIHGYNGEQGEIDIIGEISGDLVTYTVIDYGCGIKDVKKAREPLFTGKPDMERSGMGFSIMEAFMDELLVESSIGNGTRITMKKKVKNDIKC